MGTTTEHRAARTEKRSPFLLAGAHGLPWGGVGALLTEVHSVRGVDVLNHIWNLWGKKGTNDGRVHGEQGVGSTLGSLSHIEHMPCVAASLLVAVTILSSDQRRTKYSWQRGN